MSKQYVNGMTKMEINTTDSHREMDDFRKFFSDEKKATNSKEFKNIDAAFQKYQEAFANVHAHNPQQQQLFDEGFENAAKDLQEACKTYMEKRDGALTQKGQERLQKIGQLSSAMGFWGVERAGVKLHNTMAEMPTVDINNHIVATNTAVNTGNSTFTPDHQRSVNMIVAKGQFDKACTAYGMNGPRSQQVENMRMNYNLGFSQQSNVAAAVLGNAAYQNYAGKYLMNTSKPAPVKTSYSDLLRAEEKGKSRNAVRQKFHDLKVSAKKALGGAEAEQEAEKKGRTMDRK